MNEFDEDPRVSNGHAELEILIARPVTEVWAQWIDLGSWISSHNIEEISEARRIVGAITRVSPKVPHVLGDETAYYHFCKIIKMVPARQYLVKTYSEKGGSYGVRMMGFDDTRFFAVGDTTRIVFNFFGQSKGTDIADEPGVMNLEGSCVGMLRNLENLKRIVEGHL